MALTKVPHEFWLECTNALKGKAFVDLIGDSVLNRNPVQNNIQYLDTFPESFL